MSTQTRASRSQKRLMKDITKAAETREKLLDSGKLSLPSGEGKLAIVVSRLPNYGSELDPREQHRIFLDEAEKLKQERALGHQAVVVRRIATVSDMAMDFADPEVTDIVMIGHGNINCLWAEGGKHFDWRMAAKAAKSLKQGAIEQRMCGNLVNSKKVEVDGQFVEELPHQYSVPLGTFAVSQLSNVIAAAGVKVPDEYPDNGLFQPVFSDTGDAPGQIQAFNDHYGNRPSIAIKE